MGYTLPTAGNSSIRAARPSTWVIVLLGAELTAAFERRNQPFIADHWGQSEPWPWCCGWESGWLAGEAL